MTSNRYEYFSNVYNIDIAKNSKGFLRDDILGKLREKQSDDIYLEINTKYQYRPDLIAYDMYSDVRLQWVIIYANDIYDSPEGFVLHKKVRIPSLRRLSVIK